MVLVATGVVASVFAFVYAVRGDRRALAVRRWVSEHRPDTWRTLPWIYRQFFTATITVDVLKRGALASDGEFAARCSGVTRLQRLQLAGLAVAAARVALALIGRRVWGWTW